MGARRDTSVKWVRVPGTMPKRRVATRQRPMARTRAKGSPAVVDAPDIAATGLAATGLVAAGLAAVSALTAVSAAELAGKPSELAAEVSFPEPAIKVSSLEPVAIVSKVPSWISSEATSSASSPGAHGFSNHMRATIFP